MNNIINILIRVTFRPQYFEKCINSVLSQSYTNFRIICSYDDELCLKYLKKYKDKIEYFFAGNKYDKKKKYFYNLYCNDLLDKVKDGYIIFLDDDDMFDSNYSLEIINNKLKNNNDIIFWKFKLSDKEIYSENINNIQSGYVANSTYCFHSQYKDLSRWEDTQIGDFAFLDKMLKRNNFNRIFIDKIFTRTIWFNTTKFGNEGKKIIQMSFEEFFYKYYIEDLPYTFDENYYSEKYDDLKYFKNKQFNFNEHWIKFGKKELRSCSDDYNKIFNIKLNSALLKFNELK